MCFDKEILLAIHSKAQTQKKEKEIHFSRFTVYYLNQPNNQPNKQTKIPDLKGLTKHFD